MAGKNIFQGGAMKKILILLSVVLGLSLQAETFTLDTAIGAYTINSQSQIYRNTRISAALFSGTYLKPLSIRFENEIVGGLGMYGNQNNYRISGQMLYKIDFGKELYVSPFVGIGLTSSDVIALSLSVDAGLEARYKLTDMFSVPLGGEIITFSDSSIINYYGGVGIKLMDWLSVDGLYTATMTGGVHNIGFGGRVSIIF